MPSFSQILGIKKGNNSSKSGKGFFPFTRKVSSGERHHLRARSENTVVCRNAADLGCPVGLSKRTSPEVFNGHSFRESYDSRYERYRNTYLVTSPERELCTLNAALLNVQKWLKKKHQSLQSLQLAHDQQRLTPNNHQPLSSDVNQARAPENKKDLSESPGAESPENSKEQSSENRKDSSPGEKETETESADSENSAALSDQQVINGGQFEDQQQDKQAFLEKLVLESGPQQEAVDVLLDRGRRYLLHRASVTLEVDLHNLAFLWNSYAKQLHGLYQRTSADPPDPDHLQTYFCPEGKENLHRDPSSGKKLPKSSVQKRLFANTAQNADISRKENLKSSPIKFSNSHFDRGESPSTDQPPISTDITDFDSQQRECLLVKASPETLYTSSRKEDLQGIKGEADLPASGSSTAKVDKNSPPCRPRRVLPLTPPERHAEAGKEGQATGNRKFNPVTKETEEPNLGDTSLSSSLQSSQYALKASPPSSSELRKCGSPRYKVLAASLWPGDNTNGWLKIPGQGFFSSHRQNPKRPILGLHTSDSVLHSEVNKLSSHCNLSSPCSLSSTFQPPEEDLADKRSSSNSPDGENQAGSSPTPERALPKKAKESRNERQQQQQEREPFSLPPSHEGEPGCAAPFFGLQSGLTASEEDLMMDMEQALREIQGADTPPGTPPATLTASHPAMDTDKAAKDSGSPNRDSPGPRTLDLNLDELDLPTGPKRRRMNTDTPSSLSSCSGSPLLSGENSPAGTLPRDFKQRYKKDELWKAIESNYQYLMDKEIIETCQSTSAQSTEDGDMPNVSFAEFLQQYQELFDWLSQAQRNTQRAVNSLSEKYLNQTYQEELLERSPRREFLVKYGQQLELRYPSLKEQVHARLARLNAQWSSVEAAIAPQQGLDTANNMLQDLECDLAGLRRWLNATECRLLPLTIRADWTDAELQERLREHQALQQDIESHSRIVSAVLKLSERLDGDCERDGQATVTAEWQSLQLVALGLERRWHGIWLQSLEWQCRLEEAINRRKGLYGCSINFSGFTLPTLDESSLVDHSSDLDLKASLTSGSNGSLIELSDDSLLFIGSRAAESPRGGEESPYSAGSAPCLSPRLTNFLDRSSGDSANISECESRMGDSPRGDPLPPTSLGSDGEGGLGPPVKRPHEPKDVGYSSESQSNDETESMQQQIALECRYPGIVEVASDSPLGEKVAIPPVGGVRPDYYRMTIVDLDSTDRTTTTTDDGNTTDDKDNAIGNRLSTGGSLGARPGLKNKAEVMGGVVTDTGFTDCVDRVTSESPDDGWRPRGSQEDIEVKSWLESSDDADPGQEKVREVEETQPLPSSLIVPGSSESDSAPEGQEKIRYLIEHAEELVKASPPRPCGPGSPGKKTSPSKQTQTSSVTETSSVESSCDASSENSEDSTAEEFSTATDDADETLFNSVIHLDLTTTREDVRQMASTSTPVDTSRLRRRLGPRGDKKDRPWSVADLEYSHHADFQPLSTSESAIDRLHPHTDTDSSSSQFVSAAHSATFPRRGHRQLYQRAFSACEQSSPRATKRKLRYASSSSSATDSQASRSSGTRLAASTEEEEDRTLLYDSAELLRCAGQPPCLLESESETTEEYLTASMDEAATSADEDPHNSSSFSENAWDNYQMIYPTASEDATEEMLQWEPVDEMEFDDDFNINNSHVNKRSSLLRNAISKPSNNKLKLKPGGAEDSDSDMEDFHSVLEDSERCLKVVDHSLNKKRSHPSGTGLAPPHKYTEMLATCDTNIVCVKNVCRHLTQEDIGVSDVERVQDLLCQWEDLHCLASQRLQQSQELVAIQDAMEGVKKGVKAATQCLTYDLFTSQEQLETTISTLKVKHGELVQLGHTLADVKSSLSCVQLWSGVNVSKLSQAVHDLQASVSSCQHRVCDEVAGLERDSAVWSQYLQEQRELDAMMDADRRRLLSLLCHKEAGLPLTHTDQLHELQLLRSKYESRLDVLQALRKRLSCVCDPSAHGSFLAALADLRNQLHTVTSRTSQLYAHGQGGPEEEGVEVGRLVMEPPTVRESFQASHVWPELSDADLEAGGGSKVAKGGRVWRWLRSLPVQLVALMVMAGLVYLLDPDLEALTPCSLTVTPELRHVNGPPPS